MASAAPFAMRFFERRERPYGGPLFTRRGEVADFAGSGSLRVVSRVSRGLAQILSKSSRNGFARFAMRRELVSDRDQTTVYLLLHLRKANRTIVRLRACALAARDENEEKLRAALAALRPGDLGP